MLGPLTKAAQVTRASARGRAAMHKGVLQDVKPRNAPSTQLDRLSSLRQLHSAFLQPVRMESLRITCLGQTNCEAGGCRAIEALQDLAAVF